MKLTHEIITLFAALVWSINGFAFKILNLVPRHQYIVSEILGSQYAFIITKVIGVLELFLAIWILSLYKSRLATLLQVVLILSMNIIEFFKVPELLLFGKLNLVIATLFAMLLLINEFAFKPKSLEII